MSPEGKLTEPEMHRLKLAGSKGWSIGRLVLSVWRQAAREPIFVVSWLLGTKVK